MKNEKDRALAMAILLITVTVFSTVCCLEGLLSDDFSIISWAASSLMIGVWIWGIAYFAFNSDRKRRIWQLAIVTAGAVILTVFAYWMKVGYIKNSLLMLTPLVPIMGFADMLEHLLQIFEPDEKAIFAIIAAVLSLSNLGVCGAAGRGKEINS